MEIPGPGPAVRSPSTGSGRTDTILRAPEHLPSHRFSHAVRSPHCRGPTGLSVPRIAGGLRACPFPILPGAYGPVRSLHCLGTTGLSVPRIAGGLRACPFPILPGAYGPVRSPYCRGPTGLSVPLRQAQDRAGGGERRTAERALLPFALRPSKGNGDAAQDKERRSQGEEGEGSRRRMD